MIQISNLHFAYKKKENLFKNLNCRLSQGNIYGLLGKNGAGKTTLLKIISGILFPKKGECHVLDYESGKRDPQLLADIFFIAEEFYTPPLTIRQHASIYAPFYLRFNYKEFQDYLDEFSLAEKEKLTNLSYGQKKKFLIAFGLATNCRLFIMDEPTNGLDIPSKSQFRKLLISSINDERIFLISTHQVRDMQQLIDPIFILDNGEMIFRQTMERINESLSVQLVMNAPDNDDVLFYEKVIGGYAVLYNAHSGGKRNSSMSVDLEILFNAVINNRNKINSIFQEPDER